MAEVRAIGAMDGRGPAGVLDEVAWDPDVVPLLVDTALEGATFEVVDPAGPAEVQPQPLTIGRVMLASGVVLVALGAGVAALGPLLGPAVALSTVVVSVLLYRFVLQARLQRWGATDAELHSAMAGDELVEGVSGSTRAITVDAPVAQVWECLVDAGIGEGGWHARGLIDDGRLGGRRISPLLDGLAAQRDGSRLAVGFEVHRIEAPRLIVSVGPDGSSWCLELRELGSCSTRLVSRFRSPNERAPGGLGLADPIAFMFERRLLRDLKERAERGAPLPRSACPVAP